MELRKLASALLIIVSSTFGFAQEYKVVGYLPTYRIQHLPDINFELFTHVNLSFANPDKDGNLIIDANVPSFVKQVKAGGAKAIVSFGGGGNFSWGPEVDIYKNLLATAESRTKFVHTIMDFIRENDLDGIDNDMEGNALKLPTFNVFTQELADSVHSIGLEISASFYVGSENGIVNATDSTLAKLDYVMTMSYGGVGNWNLKLKDDGHAYGKYVQDMNTILKKRNLPAEKVIGGIPFYSVEFPDQFQQNYNDFHKTICEVLNDRILLKQNPSENDTLVTKEGHPVYLNSITTLYKKMDFAHKFGGGLMIWEIGQDCFDGSLSIAESLLLHGRKEGYLPAQKD